MAELNAGVEPLKRIIDLLPKLQVVMLHGDSSHDAWNRLIRKYPEIAKRAWHVIKTYHTSHQAFWHPESTVREERKARLRQSFDDAAMHLLSK